MRTHTSALAALLIATLTIPAAADIIVDGFDGDPVCFGSFLAPWQQAEPTGGNPGAYWHGAGMDSTAPKFLTAPGHDTPFVGDYASRGVTSLGIDFITFNGWSGGRPMGMMLIDDSETPGDGADDWAAYLKIGQVPEAGAGWASFDFPVPSQAVEMPEDWGFFRFGGQAPHQPDWTGLMQDVDLVMFVFGDPDGYYVYQKWEAGADNMRISFVPEPASLALVSLGVLAMIRRRR